MKTSKIIAVGIMMFYGSISFAQKLDVNQLDRLSGKYGFESLPEFFEMLSVANDAVYPEQVENNIHWATKALDKRGFSTEILKTTATPLLLGEMDFSKAKKTVLLYFHMDGQAVDTSKWFQENPYKAVLKKISGVNWEEIETPTDADLMIPDYRIFARSVSDDKGPLMMFLKAIDILKANNIEPEFNIKVILDFEEEQGSPNLPSAVELYKDKLIADILLIFDGPLHITNKPTLAYGARGIATMSIEVFGPIAPQHSGHYGNYAPNPALRLSQLLSSMMYEDGRVAINGWYDGITISNDEKIILARVPDDEEAIKKRLGIASTDNIGSNYQESLQYPSLSILGLKSGWVGKETRTIIPATAIAELNIRLVRESDGRRMIDLVKQHIVKQGYHLVDNEPTEIEREQFSKIAKFDASLAYAAFRTNMDSEAGRWLRKSIKSAFGEEPIEIRTMGGSVPISPFVQVLGIPAVGVPTVNLDNNQHSPNENLRYGNYINGIKTITSILQTSITD